MSIYIYKSAVFIGYPFICFTTDEWISNTNRRFININTHLNDSKFWNLGLSRIHGSVRAEVCVELIKIN